MMNTKIFSATIEPLSERKMSFTISTAAVDRDGDTINPKGWILDNYMKNPTVLWAHDYSQPPIGKAIAIHATDKGLVADVEFMPKGMNPFADMVHDMVKGGYLSATSVGFRPLESDRNRSGGLNIKRAELLEFSIVAVPSNPEALVLRRSANKSAMKEWLGQSGELLDWDSINASSPADFLDWTSINASRNRAPEINVSTAEVERVMAALAPALREGLKAGLRAQAQVAVHKAICRMSGRLD